MNLYWPKRSMFRSKEAKQKRFEAKLERAEAAASKVLQITHNGCLDGAGSAIMTVRHYGEGVGIVGVQPGDMKRVLEFYGKYPVNGRIMEITDLSLNPDHYDGVVAACARLRSAGWEIHWRDHHHKQWEGVDLKPLKAAVHTLEISPNTESGASMQQQALLPKDDFAKRLAAVHRDRDLWLNETPEGEILEFAIQEMGWKEYIDHQVPKSEEEEVVDPVIQAACDAHQRTVNAAGAKILKNTRTWTASTGEQVAVVYGWLPRNVGLHELLQQDNIQVAINVRPNGFMSLRSNKGADVCQLVAKRFDGGGHVNASGGALGLKGAGFWSYIFLRGRVPRVTEIAKAAVEELENR
ncbi:MAG: hypothetical protein ACPHID_01470 [Thermoplasmatota archaeon]